MATGKEASFPPLVKIGVFIVGGGADGSADAADAAGGFVAAFFFTLFVLGCTGKPRI